MKLFEQMKSVVSEQLGIKTEEIKEESSFKNDLGADSLDLVELVMTLEEKFSIEIPDEDAEKLQKISDVIKYIEKRLKK